MTAPEGRCARVGAASGSRLPVDSLPQGWHTESLRFERMQKMAENTTQHCHRLARPRPTPEAPPRKAAKRVAHPTGTLGPRRPSRHAPSGNAAGASCPRLPPPSPPPRSKHPVGPDRSPRRLHVSGADGAAPVDSHTQRTTPARGGRGAVSATPWGDHVNHAIQPESPANKQQTRVPGCIPSPKPRRSTL